MQNWSNIGKSFGTGINKISRKLNKGVTEKSKQLEKGIKNMGALAKMTNIIIGEIGQESRVPVDAALKKKVFENFNNKCHHFSECKIDKSDEILQMHHMDMNNSHTIEKNLELLCPNHHMMEHRDMFRRKYSSGTSRLIQK